LYLSIRIRKEKEEFPKERENTDVEGEVVGREKKLSRAKQFGVLENSEAARVWYANPF
jgi:hypothetical protein